MIATWAVLFALVLIDGACSGFRAGVGRTGLVRHRAADVRASWTGVGVSLVLLLPAVIVGIVDLRSGRGASAAYGATGRALLAVLAPYSVVVLAALVAYGVLGWRQKYVAMALVLGPCTLLRPWVAAGAGISGCLTAHDGVVCAAVSLCVCALLVVEPALNWRWRSPTPGYLRSRI